MHQSELLGHVFYEMPRMIPYSCDCVKYVLAYFRLVIYALLCEYILIRDSSEGCAHIYTLVSNWQPAFEAICVLSFTWCSFKSLPDCTRCTFNLKWWQQFLITVNIWSFVLHYGGHLFGPYCPLCHNLLVLVDDRCVRNHTMKWPGSNRSFFSSIQFIHCIGRISFMDIVWVWCFY